MYDLFVRLEILCLFSVMVLITLSIPCKLSMSYESIILFKPHNNFVKSINAVMILMMERWRQWLGNTSSIAIRKGLLCPRLLQVTRMDLSWNGIESEEAEPDQMKYRACSGFQRLKVEEFENDSGYLF